MQVGLSGTNGAIGPSLLLESVSNSDGEELRALDRLPEWRHTPSRPDRARAASAGQEGAGEPTQVSEKRDLVSRLNKLLSEAAMSDGLLVLKTLDRGEEYVVPQHQWPIFKVH